MFLRNSIADSPHSKFSLCRSISLIECENHHYIGRIFRSSCYDGSGHVDARMVIAHASKTKERTLMLTVSFNFFCVWSNAEITLHHNTNRVSWNFTWDDDVYLLRRLFKQLHPILPWTRRANIRASILLNRPGRRRGIPLQVGCRRAKSCSTSEWPSLPVHWHNLSHRTHATSPPWPRPSPSTQLLPIPYLPSSRLYSSQYYCKSGLQMTFPPLPFRMASLHFLLNPNRRSTEEGTRNPRTWSRLSFSTFTVLNSATELLRFFQHRWSQLRKGLVCHGHGF